REDHGREASRVSGFLEQPPSLVGIVRVEAEREPAPLQEVAHLVALRRPALADDFEQRPPRPAAPGPAAEDLADDRVEPLLRVVAGLDEERIELAHREGAVHQREPLGISVADEGAARGLRTRLADAGETVEPRHLRRPEIGDDERELLTARADLLEPRERRDRRGVDHDLIVASESPLEGPGHALQRLRIVIDHEDHWIRHSSLRWSPASAAW